MIITISVITVIVALISWNMGRHSKTRSAHMKETEQLINTIQTPSQEGTLSNSEDGTPSNHRKVSSSQAYNNAEGKHRVGSFEIMSKSLNNIGCQPEIKEENVIDVLYQGEKFCIECNGPYARIWDPMWIQIRANDPNLPKLREAINAANFFYGPTVVMADPNEDGIIGLHSRYDIMLHPACLDNDDYVKASLDIFFATKERVREQFNKLHAQQVEAVKKRRPVGFTTDDDQD